jgi:hypothetical protein
MRVQDLDWPADLFLDAMPASESSIMLSVKSEIRSDTEVPLGPPSVGMDSMITSATLRAAWL